MTADTIRQLVDNRQLLYTDVAFEADLNLTSTYFLLLIRTCHESGLV